MPDEITLELPIPPTINHYYGHSGTSKFITAQGKAFRRQVALTVMFARATGRFGTSRLALDVLLHFKSNAGDVDNRIKPLFDALERATLFENDRQIDEFHVKRGEVDKAGRCVVRVWSV